MAIQTQQQTGFTFVELVAVIAIIGIMAAVAAPKLLGADVFEVRGSKDTLISAVRYAQKTAVAQRRIVYVVVDTVNRTLCLGYSSDCVSAVIDPATQSAYQQTLSQSLILTVSNAALGFDGLGRPVPNASASYQLNNTTDSNQPPQLITVEAETGFIHE